MHGSAIDDTVKRASRAGTKSRLHGHEPDAIQCDTIKKKNMTGQSFIEWIQQPSSKGNRVGATKQEFIQFILV